MQSNVKTRDSRRINQVFATCTNTFPMDENIVLSSKLKIDYINIPPQLNKDELSNKNKYDILNQNKVRQLDQHLAIINQHSHRSLDTQLFAYTLQSPLQENKQNDKADASNEPNHSTEEAIIATDKPESIFK